MVKIATWVLPLASMVVFPIVADAQSSGTHDGSGWIIGIVFVLIAVGLVAIISRASYPPASVSTSASASAASGMDRGKNERGVDQTTRADP